MSSQNKKVLFVIVAVILGLIVLKSVIGAALWLFWTALPVVIVAGLAYIVYSVATNKSLGGNRRRILP